MMPWPFHNKILANYWLKVFGLYVLTEACIQLLFNFILNNFSQQPVSNLGFHLIMLFFQCLLIWPIWCVAHSVQNKPVITQWFINLVFFVIYSYFWLGPVQDSIRYLHQYLQQITVPEAQRLQTPVDTSFNYQLLKHTFRLSWFYLANYFFNYRLEEEKRLHLAVANKELQLKLLTWHLNPDFYFKTISHLRQLSLASPASCTTPILHLAKVMEYVIYESREKLIGVAKEIHFLQNYIELVNRQDSHSSKFTLNTRGCYDKLKIAPLLLAGFIDRIASYNNDLSGNEYAVSLNFLENIMLFRINGVLNGFNNPLLQDDVLYTRITGLYSGRFTYK